MFFGAARQKAQSDKTTADANVTAAKDVLDKASGGNTAVRDAQAALDKALAAQQDAQAAYDKAQSDKAAADKALSDAKDVLDRAGDDSAVDAAQSAYDNAFAAQKRAKDALDAADRANDQAVADLIAARENLDRADSELAAAKKAFEQAKVNQPPQPDQPSKPSQPNQPSQTVAVKKSHDDNKTRIENGIALQKVTNKADKVMASTGDDTAAIAIVSMTLVMGAAGVEIVRRGRHHA